MLLKDRSESDLLWEAERLARMLEKLQAMHQTPSKLQRLLTLLYARREGDHLRQTVVFTRFYDSLTSIRDVLAARSPGLAVGTFAGREQSYYDTRTHRRVLSTREGVKAAFLRGDIELLLCTDAAAEGLNLQTADMLINFDMGWNPMKVEQRIGRIDRIGQTHDRIDVYHMIYAGSIEEHVYCTLADRLKSAGFVVGAQQVMLLPVEPEDFRNLFAQEAKAKEEDRAAVREAALKALEEEARKRLAAQKAAAASLELSAAEQYEIYQKEHARMKARRLPARVEDLWQALAASPYLKARGGTWHAAEDGRIYDCAAAFLHGTDSRERCGRETPFLTWGAPQVDAFLARMSDALHAAQHPNLARLVVGGADAAGGLPWEIVGYLVQTTTGPRLVTTYRDLEALTIADTPLTAADIAAAKAELARRAAAEAQTFEKLGSILQANARQAALQTALTRDVAIALLEKAARDGYERYRSASAELLAHERKSYPLALPAHPYAGNEPRLLYPVTITGGAAHISAPPTLWHAALALCDRISGRLAHGGRGRKIKRADQTCDDILRRLHRIKETPASHQNLASPPQT